MQLYLSTCLNDSDALCKADSIDTVDSCLSLLRWLDFFHLSVQHITCNMTPYRDKSSMTCADTRERKKEKKKRKEKKKEEEEETGEDSFTEGRRAERTERIESEEGSVTYHNVAQHGWCVLYHAKRNESGRLERLLLLFCLDMFILYIPT